MFSKTFALSLMASVAAARHQHGNSHIHLARAVPTHAIQGFEYVGCVFGLRGFENVNDMTAPFTPEDCQHECEGFASYAAVGNGCHCNMPSALTSPVSYQLVDEAECDCDCVEGNAPAGKCGGAKGFYNLYKMIGTEGADCPEDNIKAAAAPAPAPPAEEPKPSVVLKVVHECPDDCPEHAAEKLAIAPAPAGACPPEGCPAEAPAPDAKILACPPEGCHAPEPANTPEPAITAAAAAGVHVCPGSDGCPEEKVANKLADVNPPACDGIDCIITPSAPVATPMPLCPGPACEHSTTLTRAATPTNTETVEDNDSESAPAPAPAPEDEGDKPASLNGAERGVVFSWTPFVVTAVLVAVFAL